MSNAFLDHEFESRGVWNGPGEFDYSPPAGVRMRFKKFDNPNPAAGSNRAYYKMVITQDTQNNMSGPIIQKAVYLEDGPDRLVGANIEVLNGRLMNETIVVVRDAQSQVTGLDHQLRFWDGAVASWPCQRV